MIPLVCARSQQCEPAFQVDKFGASNAIHLPSPSELNAACLGHHPRTFDSTLSPRRSSLYSPIFSVDHFYLQPSPPFLYLPSTIIRPSIITSSPIRHQLSQPWIFFPSPPNLLLFPPSLPPSHSRQLRSNLLPPRPRSTALMGPHHQWSIHADRTLPQLPRTFGRNF